MPKVPEQNISDNIIGNIVSKLLWLEEEVESLKTKVLEHKQVHELTHPVSEIEKLYKNAGVELVADVKFPTKDVNYNVSYPPFTAEKQIEIVKFLLAKDVFKCYQHYTSKAYIVLTDDVKDFICNKPFDEFLASYINYLWLSLTEKEKQQIKGILE